MKTPWPRLAARVAGLASGLPSVWLAVACLSLGSLGLATVAEAQPTASPPAAPPAVASQDRPVDTATSRIYVLVGKSGLVGHVHAVEARLASGHLRLGATAQAGQWTFDMRSFVVDTPAARTMLGLAGEVDASTREQTQTNMLGPEVLDVARHAIATFRIDSALPSTQVRPQAGTAYDLRGTFVLKGVERPLAVTAAVEDRAGTLLLRGSFSLKQSAYGMKPYAKFGGMVGVADELKIWGDVWLPAGPAPSLQPRAPAP